MVIAVHPVNESQAMAVKAALDALNVYYEEEPDSDGPYNPEFVARINESMQQVRDGKGVRIDVNDLWKNRQRRGLKAFLIR
jgi:hypothetical protein